MKGLMIWIGAVPEWVMQNIKHNSMFCDIILLTNQADVTISNIDVINIDAYVENDKYYNKENPPWKNSDYLRLLYLSKNKGVVYLDCDTLLNKKIVVQNTETAFFGCEWDIFIMYGNVKYFKNLLARCILNTNKKDYAWVIRETTKDRFVTGIIDSALYSHGEMNKKIRSNYVSRN